jgi:hypothetical protein
VDSIIPLEEVQALADDVQFWDARDAVNDQMEGYITHCFPKAKCFCGATG